MKCRKCNGETVKNQANWKEFYYCRTCKVEVVEATVKDDIEALYDIIVRKKQPYNLDIDKDITNITKKLFFGSNNNGDPMNVDPEDDKKLEEIIRTMGDSVDLSWKDWGDDLMLRYFNNDLTNLTQTELKDKWFIVWQIANGIYLDYCKKLQNNNKGTGIIAPLTVYFS